MITKEQCRAARGLLGWTQQGLADAAGLSKTAINNFERGTHDMRLESLQSITRAFENAEIELVGDYGVHKRRDSVVMLKGDSALADLWDDIIATLKDGGEVTVTNVDERRSYDMAPRKLMEHLSRLEAHGISERLLSCEGDDFFLQPLKCYRWLPKEIFRASMSSFVYGDKVALQLWDDAMIIVIHSQAAAQAEQARFEYLWALAKKPMGVPGKGRKKA